MAYRQNSQDRGPYDAARQNDSHDPYGGYNAYNNHQPHQTYDQGGYNQYAGVPKYQDNVDRNTPSPEDVPPVPPSKEDLTAYEHDDQVARARPRGRFAGSKKSFKNWRSEGRENLWTRGSRTRTCGRFLCCTVMTIVFLIISILLSLVLWVKPPNIIIGTPAQNGTQAFTFQNSELSFNLGANITVDNPNYFGVALKKVELDLIYPVGNYPVGGGVQEDINIRSNTQTNFTFPFSLRYNTSDTVGTAAFQDIVNKCGASQNLKVNYELKLSIRIIVVSISPTISNSFTFGCPIDPADIEKLLGGSLAI